MPVPLLEGHYEDIPEDDSASRIRQLERRVDELESRVAGFRVEDLKRDAVIALLNVLGKSMKQVASGQFDLDDVDHGAASSKWDAVKKRLPPKHAEAIDMLILQGTMRRKEMSAALKMNYTNCVNNLIGPLIRQGWIVDNGGQLSLKEL